MEEKKVKAVKETKETKPLSQTDLSDATKTDIQRTKEALENQPKVSFLVPLAPGETEGSYETVSINGYTLQIKKGALVVLPQQIVEILANKYKVEMETTSRMSLNRKEDGKNFQQALE